MKMFNQITSKIALLSFLVLINTKSAFAAGGIVTFTLPSSSPAAIPTLSGTMLILLSLLLLVVAFRTAKQKKSNINKLFVTFLGTGFLVAAGSGAKLVSDANAGVAGINFEGSNSIEIPIQGNSNIVLNNNNPQTISFTIIAENGSLCFYSIDNGANSIPAVNQTGSLPSESNINITCEAENLNIQDSQITF